MEVYDQNGNLLEEYDLEKGYLQDSTRTVHHDAVEGVEPVWHYEVIREYPNGGRDLEKVFDVVGVKAQEAYDEEVPIQIYVPFPEEEEDVESESSDKETE